MAELIEPAGGPGTGDDADAKGKGTAGAAPLADPRAVRVRLAATSRTGDEAAMRVSPAADPLRPSHPSVGVGPLGGAAVPAATPAPAVRAQRRMEVDGEAAEVEIIPAGIGRWTLVERGDRTPVVMLPAVAADGGTRRREVLVDGFRFEVETESERIAALRERAGQGRGTSARTGPLEVRAIIPGKVVAVSVAAGDAVTAGQQLLVVEAMKMQNELRAPRDGTIARVDVAPGVSIEVGDLLVVIS